VTREDGKKSSPMWLLSLLQFSPIQERLLLLLLLMLLALLLGGLREQQLLLPLQFLTIPGLNLPFIVCKPLKSEKYHVPTFEMSTI
jgi:hypothetical protein